MADLKLCGQQWHWFWDGTHRHCKGVRENGDHELDGGIVIHRDEAAKGAK